MNLSCKTNRSNKKDRPVLDTMSMVFSTSAAAHRWQQCNLPIPQCSWMHPVSTIHPNRSMGMNIYWLVAWGGPLGSFLDINVYLLRPQTRPVLPASARQIIVFRVPNGTCHLTGIRLTLTERWKFPISVMGVNLIGPVIWIAPNPNLWIFIIVTFQLSR